MTSPDHPRQVVISQKASHVSPPSPTRSDGSDDRLLHISGRNLAEIFHEQLNDCRENVRGPLYVAYGKILKVSAGSGTGFPTRWNQENQHRTVSLPLSLWRIHGS